MHLGPVVAVVEGSWLNSKETKHTEGTPGCVREMDTKESVRGQEMMEKRGGEGLLLMVVVVVVVVN